VRQTKIYKHHNFIVLTLRINSKFVCSLIKQKYHHAPNHRGLKTWRRNNIIKSKCVDQMTHKRKYQH
jgi:hypothetical protein